MPEAAGAQQAPQDERRAKLAKLAEQARLRRARKRAERERADRRLGLVPEPPQQTANDGTAAAGGSGAEAPASKIEPPAAADPSAFIEPCRQLWTAAGALAAGQDERLALSAHEVDQLAQASAPVAAKYLPEAAATPEGALAVMVLSICAPKVLAVVMQPRPRAEEPSDG